MKFILTKLSKIQTELKAPKGQMNTFGKYKYRSCEDIMEAVKPLLAKHQCALPISDKVIMVGDRYYIEATATLFDCESGEHYSTTASAREEESKKGMDGSQVTGASSSYARKCALNGLLDIDDTKDSDSTNTHGKEAKQNPNPATKEDEEAEKKYQQEAEDIGKELVTPVAIKAIYDLLDKTGEKLDLKRFGLKKIEDMNKDQYFEYVAELRPKVKK